MDTARTLARSPDLGLALRRRPSEHAGEVSSCKTQAPVSLLLSTPGISPQPELYHLAQQDPWGEGRSRRHISPVRLL